jgi:hypothetical protein
MFMAIQRIFDMYRLSIMIACLGLIVLSFTGCNKDGVARVEGTLTVDGQPAPAGVKLIFDPVEPGERESTAETDEDGRYVAKFSVQREGVYMGDCVVFLEIPLVGGPAEEGEELNLKYPDEYYREIKAFTVEGGKNVVDLEITSKK